MSPTRKRKGPPTVFSDLGFAGAPTTAHQVPAQTPEPAPAPETAPTDGRQPVEDSKISAPAGTTAPSEGSSKGLGPGKAQKAAQRRPDAGGADASGTMPSPAPERALAGVPSRARADVGAGALTRAPARAPGRAGESARARVGASARARVGAPAPAVAPTHARARTTEPAAGPAPGAAVLDEDELREYRRDVENQVRRWAAMARRAAEREADLHAALAAADRAGVGRPMVAAWVDGLAGDLLDGSAYLEQLLDDE